MKKTDLNNELDELGSSLGKLPKKENFELPDNYFNELHESVVSQISSAKTFYSLNKKIEALPPADYFESLEEKLVSKTVNSNANKKIVPLRRILAIAASICLIIGVTYLFFQNSTTKNDIVTNEMAETIKYLESELDNTEVEAYYTENFASDINNEVNNDEMNYLINETDLTEIESY